MNIRKLLGLCEHNWIQISVNKVYDISFGRTEHPTGTKYTRQCTKCKKVKSQIV